MTTKTIPHAMLRCIAISFLLCGRAHAQIALHDGSIFSTNVTGSGVTTIANHFTVTAGATVLVAALWDDNTSDSTNGSPSFMTWSNTTMGTTQTLVRAVSQNEQAGGYSDCDLFYLYNPSPGTGMVSATDRFGGSTPSLMFLQTYTLSGVATTSAPFAAGNGNATASILTVNTPAGTVNGSWAPVVSVNYNGGGGNSITNTASSGGAVGFNFQPDPPTGVLQMAMGYITNLSAGASTITSSATGVATHMAMSAMVFTPVVGAGTNAVTPQFSNLSSQTINYGANVVLTGTVGTSSNSLPNGSAVSASVDGVTQSGDVYDSSGDFSISYDSVGVPASGTPYTVTYVSSIATGFNSATNTSTTMTVNPLPVVLGGFEEYSSTNTTTVPASDLYVANLVGSDNLTLSGSVTIANTNVGVQPITSISGLTLGGTAMANYTLTGTTGSVSIISSGTQTNFGITEIRTASPTELVAYYSFTNVSPPIYNATYPTNLVNTSQPAKWTLNGTPVQAISGEFVTESKGVDYHIYLQVPQLVNGTFYTLISPFSTNSFTFQDSQIFCESIKVNQNGYSALSQTRYANFAIYLGTGGSQPISGPLPAYTVINQFTGQEVASGTLQAVPTAQPDTSSGDYVYRINLSSVPPGGPYRVVVSGYGCSYPFGVGGDFSSRLAYVAFRGLYYQRCGCPIVTPFAYANIRPFPCHTNIYDDEYPDDGDALPNPVSTSGPRLMVHGGYHDASNPPRNAYAIETPIVLMTTYETFPQYFTSNQFNIPVNFDAAYNALPGGNGIPDILNEANWGLMLYTNLQGTSKEPAGAVAYGTGADGDPGWINFDEDTDVYSTETNTAWSSGMAAGAFMQFARLIQPFNPTLSAAYEAHGIAAYSAAGGNQTPQDLLYYNIQYYLLTGDLTASNYIQANYTGTSSFPNTYYCQSGDMAGYANDAGGYEWMAGFFMSYITATNRPTNPTVVAYLKSVVQQAADKEVGYVTNDAYPSGWPTNINPYTVPYTQGGNYYSAFTEQGEFGYPCLMEWALTGTQKYIDAVSVLMDYDQGLNPLGKCYLVGMGFNRVNNPENRETIYAETNGLGGPIPGATINGPGTTQASQGETGAAQIPNPNNLPRERVYVDNLGNYEWSEFSDYQNEDWPAAVYEVLAQGATWGPALGEPFLYNGAAITPNGSGGYTLQFGGIPYQTYHLQAATSLNGPWTTVSGAVTAPVTGLMQFTHNPNSAQTFYRVQGPMPIY
ncbi:MAG: glycoside hydrolase family 9 protein [Verrucomicrobiota bacterium]|jgi:endoglucanase